MVSADRRKGFTLIELLVVIAIIAILAAILFPVFAKARENARKSTCQSNLKQIALAVTQYKQDYDERYLFRTPPCVSMAGAANQPWWMLLNPYMKSGGVLECPSQNQEFYNNAGGCGQPMCNGRVPGQTALGYGFSIAIGSHHQNNGNTSCCGGRGGKDATLVAPAESFICADAARADVGGGLWAGNAACAGSFSDGICAPITFANRAAGCAHGVCGFGGTYGARLQALNTNSDSVARHSGGANIAFADGHVKWFKNEQIKGKSVGGPIRFNGYELYDL